MKIFQNKKTTFLIVSLLVTVVFLFCSFSEPVSAQTGECEVVAAKWRTNADMPADDFTYPGNEPLVYVDIKTQNCIDQAIEITIRSYNFYTQFGLIPDPDIDVADGDPITVLQNDFTLIYKATTEGCLTDYSGWDCQFYFHLVVPGGDFDSSYYSTIALVSSSDAYYVSGAMLTYDCEDGFLGVVCDGSPPAWVRVMEDESNNMPGSENGIFPYGFSHSLDQFNSAPISTTFDPQTFPLVQLPGFSNTCENPPCSALGNFIRGFFTLLIVVAGILAFIMIVVGAITYMSTDAIGGKSSGKEMMLNAVLGLVLALGAWIILNTINPNLAANLGINIPVVYINPASEPETGIGTGAVGETITLNLVDGTTTTLAACDQTKMEQVTAFGKTFKIYEGLVSSIQAVNAQWVNAGGQDFYEIKSIGGYNCRKVKGTNTWSAHAFGVAVDINPAQNPFSPPSQNQLTTDMPPAFVQMWTEQGWGWGGGWATLKDAMHFSKYPTSEGGNAIVTQ